MNSSKNVESIKSLSCILSTSFFRKVTRDGSIAVTKARLSKHSRNVFSRQHERYKTIVTELYQLLKTDYCNEYVYKNTIVNRLLLEKYDLNVTTMLDEFNIGRSIADMILINGEPVLYEIKTALDNTERLPSQIEDYKKAVSRIYLVVSSEKVACILNKYHSTNVGVYEFTDDHRLVERRKAKLDNRFLDHLVLFKLLRKEEYLEIVNSHFGFLPDVPNTKIFSECSMLIRSIDLVQFQKMVFGQLKKRRLKCPDYLRSESTPYELKYACYTLNLSRVEYNKLYSFLNSKP